MGPINLSNHSAAPNINWSPVPSDDFCHLVIIYSRPLIDDEKKKLGIASKLAFIPPAKISSKGLITGGLAC